MVDATLIAAPSSTKNATGERDPEMTQSRKGQQCYFGMKCHIGVDADAGYQGANKRPEVTARVNWHVAMRPGKRRVLDRTRLSQPLLNQADQVKARIRAKVEHPFRIIKRQFGHVKVRYRGLSKNTAQLHTLFALANLWLMRRKLLAAGA